MRGSVFVHILLILLVCLWHTSALGEECPCQNSTLCEAVQVGPREEVFLFQTVYWKQFPWGHFTTIATYDEVPDELLCMAHAHNVRIVKAVGGPKMLNDSVVRQQWVQEQVSMVKSTYIDGINLDLERTMAVGSPQVQGLTDLLTEVAIALHQEVPGSQVSFDGAMEPGYEGRNYDYGALSKELDFVFVMAYDLNDFSDPPQWNDHTLANSPFPVIQSGIASLEKAGVPREKLVLGLPWYGYGYVCQFWDKVPPSRGGVQGCNVSLSLDTQFDFKDIVGPWARAANGPPVMDNSSTSMVLSFGDPPDIWGQIWYDDARTIAIKSQWASEAGLRGVGMWTADKLNYSDPAQTRSMWGAIVGPWYPLPSGTTAVVGHPAQ